MSRKFVRTLVVGLTLAAVLAAPSHAAAGGPSRGGAGWRWLAGLWERLVVEATAVWPGPPATPAGERPDISLGIDPNG